MDRRDFLKLTCASGASLMVGQAGLAARSHRRKPNIVFVILDELGY